MRGGHLDDAVITLLQSEGAIAGFTDELTFEDVNALLERVNMGVNRAAGIKLADAELLMDGACLAVDD
jgi:hypothetical protein